MAVISILTMGIFTPSLQAQEFPSPDPANPCPWVMYQKFTARGSTPDQAITRAFAKVGIYWERPLQLPQIIGTDFAVMPLPVDPSSPQVYQAWVVVRYRIFVEGEGK